MKIVIPRIVICSYHLKTIGCNFNIRYGRYYFMVEILKRVYAIEIDK